MLKNPSAWFLEHNLFIMYLPDRMTDKYMAKLSFHILEQLIDASIKGLGYDCCFYRKTNEKCIIRHRDDKIQISLLRGRHSQRQSSSKIDNRGRY